LIAREFKVLDDISDFFMPWPDFTAIKPFKDIPEQPFSPLTENLTHPL
jgi:hypothetical protein